MSVRIVKMTYHEFFDHGMSSLIDTYPDVYRGERLGLMYRELRHLDPLIWRAAANYFIGSSLQAPLLGEFEQYVRYLKDAIEFESILSDEDKMARHNHSFWLFSHSRRYCHRDT